MKCLALDLGNRRIGMAVGGAEGVPVVPAGYLDRRNLRQDLERLIILAREREIEAIVVGIPFSLSGREGQQARLARGFVRALEKDTDLPVYCVDERFTSVEAEGLLKVSGVQPSRRKGEVDAAAAVLILERFLAREDRQR